MRDARTRQKDRETEEEVYNEPAGQRRQEATQMRGRWTPRSPFSHQQTLTFLSFLTLQPSVRSTGLHHRLREEGRRRYWVRLSFSPLSFPPPSKYVVVD
jgi:hypothetical protein